MAGQWGASEFATSTSTPSSLQSVVDQFPSKLKQAMLAAASRQLIRRRNWNGCAMNAAGFEVGKTDSVQNISSAAEAFGVSSDLVSKFIQIWDGLWGTDEECTETLRNTIIKAGLFNEPETGKRKATRIVSVTVFKQKMAEYEDKFENFQIPDEDVALDILDGTLAGV